MKRRYPSSWREAVLVACFVVCASLFAMFFVIHSMSFRADTHFHTEVPIVDLFPSFHSLASASVAGSTFPSLSGNQVRAYVTACLSHDEVLPTLVLIHSILRSGARYPIFVLLPSSKSLEPADAATRVADPFSGSQGGVESSEDPSAYGMDVVEAFRRVGAVIRVLPPAAFRVAPSTHLGRVRQALFDSWRGHSFPSIQSTRDQDPERESSSSDSSTRRTTSSSSRHRFVDLNDADLVLLHLLHFGAPEFDRYKAWRLPHPLERVVFIRPDAVVVRNVDDLFECPGDICSVFIRPKFFDVRVLSFAPNFELFERALDAIEHRSENPFLGHLTFESVMNQAFVEDMRRAPLFTGGFTFSELSSRSLPTFEEIRTRQTQHEIRAGYKPAPEENTSTSKVLKMYRLPYSYDADHIFFYQRFKWDMECQKPRVLNFRGLSFWKPWYWFSYPFLTMSYDWLSLRESLPDSIPYIDGHSSRAFLGALLPLLFLFLYTSLAFRKRSTASGLLRSFERFFALGATRCCCAFVRVANFAPVAALWGVCVTLLAFTVGLFVIPPLTTPQVGWPLFFVWVYAVELFCVLPLLWSVAAHGASIELEELAFPMNSHFSRHEYSEDTESITPDDDFRRMFSELCPDVEKNPLLAQNVSRDVPLRSTTDDTSALSTNEDKTSLLSFLVGSSSTSTIGKPNDFPSNTGSNRMLRYSESLSSSDRTRHLSGSTGASSSNPILYSPPYILTALLFATTLLFGIFFLWRQSRNNYNTVYEKLKWFVIYVVVFLVSNAAMLVVAAAMWFENAASTARKVRRR